MVLSIIFLEDKHKILLHLSIFYEYQQLLDLWVFILKRRKKTVNIFIFMQSQ
jgi:hypothetical protein